MRSSTAMAAALEKAGAPVDRARLFTLGTDVARRYGATSRGTMKFRMILLGHQELLDQLILEYLEARVSDIENLPNGGHPKDASHSPLAPGRQSKNGAALRTADTLTRVGRPRSASDIAGRATAAKVVAKLTILDTYRMSNGEIVGDVYWQSLPRINRSSAFDTALTRLMMDHAQVADTNAKVRDVLSPEQFQAMMQKAKEISDAM